MTDALAGDQGTIRHEGPAGGEGTGERSIGGGVVTIVTSSSVGGLIVSNQELKAWVQANEQALAPSIVGNRAVLDVGSRTRVELGNFPSNADIELLNAGALNPYLQVVKGATVPRMVIVQASSLLTVLEVTGGDPNLPFVEVNLADCPNIVQIRGSAVEHLALLKGQAKTEMYLNGIVTLEDVTVEATSGWSLGVLYLKGTVATSGNPFKSAGSICRSDQVTLKGSAGIELGAVFMEDEGSLPVRMIVEGPQVVSVSSLPPNSTVKLLGGGLCIGSANVPAETTIDHLTVVGSGSISLYGQLEAPIFGQGSIPGPLPRIAPDFDDLVLILGSDSVVTEAMGWVRLQAQRAVALGSASSPLVLKEIIQTEGSEVANVDLYHLRLGDLAHLAQAERIVPWIPSPSEARRLEDQMTLDAKSEQLRRERRAHFWARMSVIVREAHAPGAVQSEVRFAAARARRRALKTWWRKESLLLLLYSLVGYGERVGRPLTCLFVGSLLTTLAVGPIGGKSSIFHSFGRAVTSWWHILLAPLAFFHVVDVPHARGGVRQRYWRSNCWESSRSSSRFRRLGGLPRQSKSNGRLTCPGGIASGALVSRA